MSRMTWLFLCLELGIVLADERLDLRGVGKNTEPLLLVERDGKTAHSIQGYRPLLADLEAQSVRVLVLEMGVLCPQTLQLGFHFQFAHRVSSNLSVVSTASLHTGSGKPEGSVALAKSASIRSTSCRRSLAVQRKIGREHV